MRQHEPAVPGAAAGPRLAPARPGGRAAAEHRQCGHRVLRGVTAEQGHPR